MNARVPSFESYLENTAILSHPDPRISFYHDYHLNKSALHDMVRKWFEQNPSAKSQYMDDDMFLLVMEMDMRSYIDRVWGYIEWTEPVILKPSTQDLAFFYKIERLYPGFIPGIESDTKDSSNIIKSMKNWFTNFQSRF